MADDTDLALAADIRGLDALDTPIITRPDPWSRLWGAAWPKLAAVALVIATWQTFVWLEIEPEYVVPGPAKVLGELWRMAGTAELYQALAITLRRGAVGFALAVLIGSILGLAVSQSHMLRRAIGAAITGLQTMPSIAWFPFAILVFGLTEAAILFVIVLGAAPSIANGLISGVDHTPPILMRAGRILGASGISSWRHIVLPAALPGFVAGLKQGWAFAWRSLMAGELLVIIASQPSIGARLQFAREFSDADGLLAMMIVVLLIGIAVDGLIFGQLEQKLRRNRGLIPHSR